MPFSLAASLVKMRHRAARRLPGVAQFKIIFPLNMPKATRRAFLIVPRSFPAQADIIAHIMRTSFRRKADKGRYCVGVAVADDGVSDVAVGLDGGTLFHSGDEQHLQL